MQIKNVCQEFDIELLAYSPLALGVLAIPPNNKNSVAKTFLRSNLFRRLLPASFELRKELHKIGLERGVSQAQVALNWCRAHDAIPIPGLRNPKHAKDASDASKWILNTKERNALDALSNECKLRMPNNPFQSN